jgi:hypothetical protein
MANYLAVQRLIRIIKRFVFVVRFYMNHGFTGSTLNQKICVRYAFLFEPWIYEKNINTYHWMLNFCTEAGFFISYSQKYVGGGTHNSINYKRIRVGGAGRWPLWPAGITETGCFQSQYCHLGTGSDQQHSLCKWGVH